MTLTEKVGLTSGHHSVAAVLLDAIRGHYNRLPIAVGGCRRLGFPPLLFCDGSRGVVSGHATCFPVAVQRHNVIACVKHYTLNNQEESRR